MLGESGRGQLLRNIRGTYQLLDVAIHRIVHDCDLGGHLEVSDATLGYPNRGMKSIAEAGRSMEEKEGGVAQHNLYGKSDRQPWMIDVKHRSNKAEIKHLL